MRTREMNPVGKSDERSDEENHSTIDASGEFATTCTTHRFISLPTAKIWSTRTGSPGGSSSWTKFKVTGANRWRTGPRSPRQQSALIVTIAIRRGRGGEAPANRLKHRSAKPLHEYMPTTRPCAAAKMAGLNCPTETSGEIDGELTSTTTGAGRDVAKCRRKMLARRPAAASILGYLPARIAQLAVNWYTG